MKMQPAAIIKKLFLEGKIVTVNQEISYEDAENIAIDYDIICEKEVKVDVIEELLKRMRKQTRIWFPDRLSSVLWVTLTTVKPPCWMRSVRRT